MVSKIKLLIFSVLIFILNIDIYAQVNYHIAGGIDFTSVKHQGSIEIEPQQLIGYHLELNIQKSIGQIFYLNMSSQFLQRGYNDSNGSGFKRNYIDIQPELSFNSVKSIEFGLGLYYGIVTQFYAKSTNGEWQNLSKVGIADNNDFGLTFLVRSSFKRVIFYARYKYGIQKLNEIIYTDDFGNVLGNSSEKNREFQIGIGYKFKNDD